jgi:mannose-6-phosphate isomerase-like protein (cupin superfamily)
MNEPIKISPEEKFKLFNDQWNPKIVGDLNNCQVKLVKVQGEFNWHHHENEDELFIVVKGHLTIQFRDKNLEADPGEMILIPKMVEHCPKTNEEAWIILIDPKGTLHTGNVRNDKTAEVLERI